MRQEPKNSGNALEDGIETETITFYRGLDRLVEEYVKQQTAFKHESLDVKTRPGGGQHYETVIELTYRFNFRKSAFFIQPDLQYIIQPGGTAHLNNALVLGAQLGINF